MRTLVSKLARAIAGLLVVAAFVPGQTAQAGDVAWYNGDFDGRDAIVNQTGSPDGLVYDDFVVPTGQTWTISSVFSNDLLYDGPQAGQTAYWEIRSGVSAGNGGTLIASGDGADTQTPTGNYVVVIPGVFNVYEFTNSVNVTGVTLTAGTYWLAVAPDVSNVENGGSLITTTSGANAVGTPPGNEGNSFVTSTFFGQYFLPTSDPSIEGPGTWDYSMGITTVPEPPSLTLAFIAAAASASCLWARRRRTR